MREDGTGGGTAVVVAAGIGVGRSDVNVCVGGAIVNVADAIGAGVNEATAVSTWPEG